MKKVLLLGATGMLGSAVYNVLREKHNLVITARDPEKLHLLNNGPACRFAHRFDVEKMMADYETKQGSVYFDKFVEDVGEVDYVINAIGVTIPFSLKNIGLTFFVNSIFPHLLARRYGSHGSHGTRLIHITTDCVYSGTDGGAPYDEDSPLSPNDIYGLSKSMGEPKNCLTIRTSIIGPELSGHTGLLGWFLTNAKPGAVLNGFTDHLWNGITTHQFGLVCDKVISHSWTSPALAHVFTEPVTKYEMLMAFREKYNRDCEIKPMSGKPVVRTLATNQNFNSWLKIPSFKQMIEEMPA